jgi:hypothetical protein
MLAFSMVTLALSVRRCASAEVDQDDLARLSTGDGSPSIGAPTRRQAGLGGHGRTPRIGQLSAGGWAGTPEDTRGHATDGSGP